MQSTRSRTGRGTPKKKPKRKKRGAKPKAGAVKGERLKPISLRGMDLNDVLRRLVKSDSKTP